MNNFALIKNLLDRPLLSPLDSRMVPTWMSTLADPSMRSPDVDRGMSFWPLIELRETKDSLVCTVDVPGIKEADLSIGVSGNVLTISGRRETLARDEGDTFYAVERSYGGFKRVVPLTDGVDVAHIVATLEFGVLTIVLPKLADHTVRNIAIKSIRGKS